MSRQVECGSVRTELEERLEIALEANLLLNLLHLAVNPRDFLQADLVDLLRGQLGRRRPAKRELVEIFPVGKLPGADFLRRRFSCASRNAINFSYAGLNDWSKACFAAANKRSRVG